MDLPKEAVEAIGVLLRLIDHHPRCGGLASSMFLLSQKSSDLRIQSILEKLDQQSVSGTGYQNRVFEEMAQGLGL